MIDLATVTTTAPLTVTLDSGEEPLPAQRLSSYTPVVSDRVAVVAFGSGLLILGRAVA